jgi:predicted GNAT family N-acyltransferase
VSGGVVVRAATLDEVLPLRHAELRPGLARDAARFPGDEAAETLHVAAVSATGEVVGCATLVAASLDGRRTFQLRGMATRADRVRHGIGTAVLRTALAVLHAREGPVPVWCNARVGAVGFYARLGWRTVSAEFDVPGVGPHRRMVAP